MNIFNKVALQGLKKNRTRTFVTIIGVVLSAAMITAVATFGTSLLTYLLNGSLAKYGDWHVEFTDADSTFVQEQVNNDEVSTTAVFENIGYAMLNGAKSLEKPYLFISGFHDETFDTLPITLISGRLPENSSEILVPSHIAVKAGVKISVGDTLTLAIGNREADGKMLTQHESYRGGKETLVPVTMKTYTVVGLCDRPGFEEQSAPGYTLITQADTADQSNRFSLFVTLKNPYKVQTYASTMTGTDTYVLNDNVLRFMGISDNKLFNTLLYSVGSILITIIMVGAIFLIYNSFNISLNERTHQFGLLMSVGATARQLRNSVLFEGLCIGAIGIPIGLLVGIGSIKLILPIVANNFSTIINSTVPLNLSISVPALVVAAAVSLVTILISAYIPARKAASTPVMECIRQTNEIKIESKVVKTSKLAQRIYGLEGLLALKNFRRNRKRYRSVVLSLTLSVVLFVSGSAFGTTLKQLTKEYTVDIDGDVSLYTQAMQKDELFQLYDKLKAADSIYKSTYQANLTYPCSTRDFPSDFVSTYRASMGDESTEKTLTLPLDVQFIEDDIYYSFIRSLDLPTAEYTGQNAKVLIVGVNTIEHTTYFTNQSMDFTLTSASGEQTKTIRATFADSYPLDLLPRDSTPTYYFVVVAPWEMKAQFDTLGMTEKFGLTFWSENPAQAMTQLQSIIEESDIASDYTLLNLSSSVDLFRSLTFVVDVFTYVFVIMLSLIAVANVFNTISTNIKLRRRELAMLRSVGMSDHDFNKMMLFECAFYGMRTLLFGIPIAGILSWLIYKVAMLAENLKNFSFSFPWGSMAISALGVFLVVFITMLYATNKIRKENIIDALRDDMT
ncbi:ABC transporter permease [Aminipila butyrica]|uniref:ABC transporter permease n=1 Tax=Aminipila butyrica TaxID=433296 RepID=A0A858BUH3_9FIRM|nr:ABC transporter permease [Aminipila butyrica]QIB68725.1 ABC transporter permease [Aminipila butyrica]